MMRSVTANEDQVDFVLQLGNINCDPYRAIRHIQEHSQERNLKKRSFLRPTRSLLEEMAGMDPECIKIVAGRRWLHEDEGEATLAIVFGMLSAVLAFVLVLLYIRAKIDEVHEAERKAARAKAKKEKKKREKMESVEEDHPSTQGSKRQSVEEDLRSTQGTKQPGPKTKGNAERASSKSKQQQAGKKYSLKFRSITEEDVTMSPPLVIVLDDESRSERIGKEALANKNADNSSQISQIEEGRAKLQGEMKQEKIKKNVERNDVKTMEQEHIPEGEDETRKKNEDKMIPKKRRSASKHKKSEVQHSKDQMHPQDIKNDGSHVKSSSTRRNTRNKKGDETLISGKDDETSSVGLDGRNDCTTKTINSLERDQHTRTPTQDSLILQGSTAVVSTRGRQQKIPSSEADTSINEWPIQAFGLSFRFGTDDNNDSQNSGTRNKNPDKALKKNNGGNSSDTARKQDQGDEMKTRSQFPSERLRKLEPPKRDTAPIAADSRKSKANSHQMKCSSNDSTEGEVQKMTSKSSVAGQGKTQARNALPKRPPQSIQEKSTVTRRTTETLTTKKKLKPVDDEECSHQASMSSSKSHYSLFMSEVADAMSRHGYDFPPTLMHGMPIKSKHTAAHNQATENRTMASDTISSDSKSFSYSYVEEANSTETFSDYARGWPGYAENVASSFSVSTSEGTEMPSLPGIEATFSEQPILLRPMPRRLSQNKEYTSYRRSNPVYDDESLSISDSFSSEDDERWTINRSATPLVVAVSSASSSEEAQPLDEQHSPFSLSGEAVGSKAMALNKNSATSKKSLGTAATACSSNGCVNSPGHDIKVIHLSDPDDMDSIAEMQTMLAAERKLLRELEDMALVQVNGNNEMDHAEAAKLELEMRCLMERVRHRVDKMAALKNIELEL